MTRSGHVGLAARRPGALIALVASLVVAIGAPTAWMLTRGEETAGPGIAGQAADLTTAPSATDSAEEEQPISGSRAAATPVEPRPALFAVPSLGIATEVRSVGVRDDGQVAIPSDGDLVGWYRFGSLPGSAAGSAVIVGHRDTRAKGPGVFYTLGKIGIGDEVTVYRDDWKQITYRVSEITSYRKTALPLAQLFDRTGAPRLTVITCGGAYVPGRGYDDNVVVTAVPTGT